MVAAAGRSDSSRGKYGPERRTDRRTGGRQKTVVSVMTAAPIDIPLDDRGAP